MGIGSRIAKLLGISATNANVLPAGSSLGDPQVERARAAYGGQLQGPISSRTRWYLSDLEEAEIQANQGQLLIAARLARACMQDGVVSGVMATRCQGLLHLPKRFRGRADIVADLQAGGDEYTRSVFDEMLPPAELAKIHEDGLFLGISVGEFQPVEGRDFAVLQHLDPQFLIYRWTENRWFYNSLAGLLPITPGDGRWFLHVPGGRSYPWRQGLYRAIGQAWIRKQHALQAKSNFEDSLANAAKIIKAPNGANEDNRQAFLDQIQAWGIDNTFLLTPGWDVDLLQAGSEGWNCFSKSVEEQDRQIMIAIAGNTPLTDGGSGFTNLDVIRSIKNDLLRSDAAALAYTINTQALPAFVMARYGESALDQTPVVDWEVSPPIDRQRDAQALSTMASTITQLQGTKLPIDYRELCVRAGIPLVGDPNNESLDIDIEVEEAEPTPLKALPGGKA